MSEVTKTNAVRALVGLAAIKDSDLDDRLYFAFQVRALCTAGFRLWCATVHLTPR